VVQLLAAVVIIKHTTHVQLERALVRLNGNSNGLPAGHKHTRGNNTGHEPQHSYSACILASAPVSTDTSPSTQSMIDTFPHSA